MFRNKGWCVVIIVLLLCVMTLSADAATRRILLVGDSWPAFMWMGIPSIYAGRTMQEALGDRGFGRWEEWGEYTSIPTSFAYAWGMNEMTGLGMGGLDLIQRELRANQSIDIVHVSLGGNDFGRADYRYLIDYVEFTMQSLTVNGTPSGGTFQLTLGAQTTSPIVFNATAAEVQSALAALLGAGNVQVTDTTGGADFFIQFIGALAHTAMPAISVNNSALLGGTITARAVQFDHGWQKAWGTGSPAELLFFDAVAAQIRTVIETCLDERPGIRVCVVDYDLMNDDGGGGTVQDKNEAGGRLAVRKLLMTQAVTQDPRYLNRCFYLGPFGLMQWCYGYPNPVPEGQQLLYGSHNIDTGQAGPAGTLGYVALPGGPHSVPPYEPFGGGDSRYPSPFISIQQGVGGGDIHLRREGYVFLSKYCVDQFYGDWLRLPVVLSVKMATANPLTPNLVFNPTWAQQLAFRVTFSEPVTGFDDANVSVITQGVVVGARILSVEQEKAGDSYIVMVDRGGGEGKLGLSIIDDGNIKNAGGVPLAGDISGTFPAGEQYTLRADAGLPVAAWPMLLAMAIIGIRRVRKHS